MLGGQVCARLVQKPGSVCALVRPTADPARVAGLTALGVRIVRGDLRNPSSLAKACRGVEVVIATASAMPFAYEAGKNTPQSTDRDGMLALIDAAEAAGVRQFIHTSFTSRIDGEFPLGTAKRAVEQRLRESRRLVPTILQPCFFMEVWLSPAVGFDIAGARATIYGEGRAAISWISVRDVAEFAVASVDNAAACNATLELGGPEALGPLQVVRLFEQAAGRPFEVRHVSEAELAAQEAAAADPMQRSFAALQRAYARGAAIEMRPDAAFPVTLTTVQNYAARVVGSKSEVVHVQHT